VPLADAAPPDIDKSAELYAGERIDLAKAPDLGKYLNEKLKKAAPRVVIHLAGKGAILTSPISAKGVNLVIYCEPNAKDPITLEANSVANLARAPLLEMSGGHIELIGVRMRLANSTQVPTMIHVQQGGLSLSRCWLQGPHTKVSGGFQNLITLSNSSPDPSTLLVRDSVLVAGKQLIRLQDNVQLHARNNVFIGLADGVHFETDRPSVPMKHLLDHNSWAIRQSFFTIKTGPEFQAAGQVTMHAKSNAFLHPFDGADKGVLLRGGEAWVSRGRWSWQGRYNVYDPRLHAYFTGLEKTPNPRQLRSAWQAVWGQTETGEQEGLALPTAAAIKVIPADAATLAALLSHLDKLALPIELRGDPDDAPPGANLAQLGIKKK
jgi:hypothetical protein